MIECDERGKKGLNGRMRIYMYGAIGLCSGALTLLFRKTVALLVWIPLPGGLFSVVFTCRDRSVTRVMISRAHFSALFGI